MGKGLACVIFTAAPDASVERLFKVIADRCSDLKAPFDIASAGRAFILPRVSCSLEFREAAVRASPSSRGSKLGKGIS